MVLHLLDLCAYTLPGDSMQCVAKGGVPQCSRRKKKRWASSVRSRASGPLAVPNRKICLPAQFSMSEAWPAERKTAPFKAIVVFRISEGWTCHQPWLLSSSILWPHLSWLPPSPMSSRGMSMSIKTMGVKSFHLRHSLSNLEPPFLSFVLWSECLPCQSTHVRI